MVHARIVPWADTEELEQLKNWFYTDDSSSRRRAIGKVKAYQSKGSQYLPHVIDSTAQLTSAILLDEETNRATDTNVIKLSYTMALIRFVNGILDPNQRAQFAIPLHIVAKNVGLSSWFVDLRHWGTHERELPGLDMLRVACREALVWLWDHYWNDDAVDENESSEDEDDRRVKDVDTEGIESNRKRLEELISSWPHFLSIFRENKSYWQDDTKLISSSNFVIEERKQNNRNRKETAEEKMSNYISGWRDAWKCFSNEKSIFIEVFMKHYNSLLFHLLMLKLNTFDIEVFKWIMVDYKEHLGDTKNNSCLKKWFNKWDDLEKNLIRKLVKYVNVKNVISSWNEWDQAIEEHPSYLMVGLCARLLLRVEELGSNSNDWRKKKKRKQSDNRHLVKSRLQEHIKSLSEKYSDTEKAVYELTRDEKSNKVKLTSSTNDILGDLNNLKKRMENSMSSSTDEKPIPETDEDLKDDAKLWEEISDWKPKPFGVL
ncbi:hypothetical protein KAFR_0G00580 [Kazachstania africana CBS 2517]|uniref:Las1p n=1 Tax=Kazachstania africana (strain ATCC 22294 / BCRC 22015 / CBS 2517 / CECT 1963 / NBRC 1671 / NRRL Y-8276) TaxID=1071382 RepID=H2AXJ1_KAZAF|nr:hypothetical protein KAFR_0G00580 [Kazachstania africana CBS 2517]CCF59091.1 hypothetical protein KAFR_0G00580 [Kazachstania africana CBS 2517]